jgi:hypothetical protein
LVADIPNLHLRQKLGLHYIINATEHHGPVNGNRKANGNGIPKTLETTLPMIEVWQTLVSRLKDSGQVLIDNFNQKCVLACHLGLESDSWCTSVFWGTH